MSTGTVRAKLASLSSDERSIVLAVSILLERLRRLPEDDLNDLFGLLVDYRDAQTEEDRRAADIGIMEILEQQRLRVARLDLEAGETQRPKQLKKWLSFVSDKIRELRRNASLTQQQLAQRAGLPQSHISRIENAKHSPSRTTLEKLANALGVTLSELDPSAD